MRRKSGSRLLPVWMLLLGAAALVLRKCLYTTCVDAKGLLLRGHPLGLALTVLTGAALILAAGLGWKRKNPEPEAGKLPGAFGNAAAGAGILVTVLMG